VGVRWVSTRQNEKPRTSWKSHRASNRTPGFHRCLLPPHPRAIHPAYDVPAAGVRPIPPSSVRPLTLLPILPSPTHTWSSAPNLACPSAQDTSPAALAMHAMEEAAVRNMTSPPRCERQRTTGVAPPGATHRCARAHRAPMAESGSRIAPRAAASRAPATHTMASARGRDI
jgi:hypothetical protein